MLNTYGKCPKNSNTKGAVWSGSTLFAIPLNYLKKLLHKKQNLSQKSME